MSVNRVAGHKLYRIALDNSWQNVADINPDGYAEWREAREKGENRLSVPQPDDKGRAGNKQIQLAPRTLQHFTARIKAFIAWLVKKGLLYTDPLEKMELRIRIPFKPTIRFHPGF